MKKTSALLIALALAAVPVAQAATVQSGSYTVEPGHTQVGFSLLHLGFTPYSGLFSGATGTLLLDPAKPGASKLDVSVKIDTVQTTSDRLTDELKAADWFDAAKYPEAHFVSTKVTSTGAETATIDGRLTLHGVTRPVTLKARFIGAGVNPMDKAYTVGFEASGVIHRSEFGVSKYVPMVGDDVTLTIAGAFEKQR